MVEMMAAMSAEATERGGEGGDTSSIVASKFTLSQSACEQESRVAGMKNRFTHDMKNRLQKQVRSALLHTAFLVSFHRQSKSYRNFTKTR